MTETGSVSLDASICASIRAWKLASSTPSPSGAIRRKSSPRLHNLEDDGLPFTCAGDMNRAKRSRRERMEAKVTGLTAGEPDVRVYVTGGFLLSIELKTPKGSRSKAQKERHPKL